MDAYPATVRVEVAGPGRSMMGGSVAPHVTIECSDTTEETTGYLIEHATKAAEQLTTALGIQPHVETRNVLAELDEAGAQHEAGVLRKVGQDALEERNELRRGIIRLRERIADTPTAENATAVFTAQEIVDDLTDLLDSTLGITPEQGKADTRGVAHGDDTELDDTAHADPVHDE